MPNFALDSRPLGSNIYDSFDYSGLQLYGLEHRSLHKSMRAVEADRDRLRVHLDEHAWDDGKIITAQDYFYGLQMLFSAQEQLNLFFKWYLGKITHGPSWFEFTFDSSVKMGLALLGLPNWVPFRPGHYSGRYRVQNKNGKWGLVQNGHVVGAIEIVNSPQENQHLFESGKIDYTADTSIFFEDIDSSVFRRDTGLFGALAYSQELSEGKAATLSEDLSSLRFSNEIESNWKSLRTEVKKSLKGERGCITVGFDDFYPNRLISEQISSHLQSLGWKVELVVEDYYRPKNDCDVKFVILRGLARNSYFEALTLWSFPRAKRVFKELREILTQVESGMDLQMSSMAELGLGFPLFRIPSLYRSRSLESNPLLEVFL